MWHFDFENSKDEPYHLYSALESDYTPQIVKNQGQNLNKYQK
jgi:hypothetical protein